MKGWIIFGVAFALGVLLIASGIVYEILVGGADEADFPARVLALSGIILCFTSIYAAAAWRFRLWLKTRDNPDSAEPAAKVTLPNYGGSARRVSSTRPGTHDDKL